MGMADKKKGAQDEKVVICLGSGGVEPPGWIGGCGETRTPESVANILLFSL